MTSLLDQTTADGDRTEGHREPAADGTVGADMAAADRDTEPPHPNARSDMGELNALLCRAGLGDRHAYEVLHHLMAPMLVGAARRMLHSTQHAEDVVQEAMVWVWLHANRFDPLKGTAFAWSLTIVQRKAIDRNRSERSRSDRDARVFRDASSRFASSDSGAALSSAEIVHDVARALAGLPDSHREVIRLAFFEDCTYRQVACILGIPEGTAKDRVRTALARLRKHPDPRRPR